MQGAAEDSDQHTAGRMAQAEPSVVQLCWSVAKMAVDPSRIVAGLLGASEPGDPEEPGATLKGYRQLETTTFECVTLAEIGERMQLQAGCGRRGR